MAELDDGAAAVESAEEELLRCHKKERKELQAKIQGMKHTIPKGDKKKKKEVTAEITKLEKDLDLKHEQELNKLKESITTNDVTAEVERLEIAAPPAKSQKKSKAQKRKEKKANQEKEKEARIAEEEANNIHSARNMEAGKLKIILKERGLGIKEISSDGHCLYNALQDQLQRQDIQVSLQRLRKQTSEYLLSHQDDFLPFLINHNTGDLLTTDEYKKYCSDIVETAAWGGQHEIKALSHIFNQAIEIIQADVPPLIIGEEFLHESQSKPSIILSYHRHAYGLGEHYNSVIPRQDNEESDEDS
ncbi:deubiquitinase OTUD6B-like isoform X1 [Glandiceps talaboti]